MRSSAPRRSRSRRLFDTRGEPEFRRIEAEMLREHVRSIERGAARRCSALGGGAFVGCPQSRADFAEWIAIWLDCPFERVQRRVGDTSVRRSPATRSASPRSTNRGAKSIALADVRVAIESDDAGRRWKPFSTTRY